MSEVLFKSFITGVFMIMGIISVIWIFQHMFEGFNECPATCCEAAW